ncbi:uncharacterized protein LOC124167004 [Ischnura elegans]|uniref:uncharacterized protein LOC124167004 n=1 Tax=Ischnura elegans TaxID=197161 RepID=UPI001ED87B84|nr:uncharacterized protein LOC124167004 [Ischnura elegans]
MMAVKHKISTYIIWLKAILIFSLLSLVAGLCEQINRDENGFYHVKCSCVNPNEDLEITPELSLGFLNTSSLEITRCRNVIMHSNLFRRAYELHSIKVSEIDKLSLEPALSLPYSLQSLSLSKIGSLDHFPVPGPTSAVLHSVRSLETLSLEDITVTAPPMSSTSSFVDLPIAKIYMKNVKFSGALPAGALKFNGASLIHFSAIKCHFSEMVEGSFDVHASGNVTFDSCEFKAMEREAMKIYGECVSLINNVFDDLSGVHSISIQGKLHVKVINNHFKTLRAPHALQLNANSNSFVYIQGNQLPCGCHAENFIPAVSKAFSQTTCRGDDSFACALEQKQVCLLPNGRNESIQIYRPGLPSCPDPEALPLSGFALRGQSLIICIIVVMIMRFV